MSTSNDTSNDKFVQLTFFDDTVEVPLTQGKFAIIDRKNSDLLDFRWYARRIKKTFYAGRAIRVHGVQQNVHLHRVIMERKLGRDLLSNEQVDHIDKNGLNNTESNLRLATRNENARNSSRRADNHSGYFGVSFHQREQRWVAGICFDGRTRWLGSFDTPEDAAIAYNHAAQKYHGEFGKYNDIPGWETIYPKGCAGGKLKRDNTSGFNGVSQDRRSGKWISRVYTDGVRRYLGSFDTPQEAYAARLRFLEQIESKSDS